MKINFNQCLVAQLLARRGEESGALPSLTVDEIANLARERVVVQTGRVLVEAMLSEEGEPPLGAPNSSASRIVELALSGQAKGEGLIGASFTLGRALAAIGAPAATYYPEVAARLGARLSVPEHAEVCNAVGAVAGGVLQAVRVLITQPEEGRYRVHLSDGISDFLDVGKAQEAAEADARTRALTQAREAGAHDIKVDLKASKKSALTAMGDEIFVELEVTATAIGRPRLAAE